MTTENYGQITAKHEFYDLKSGLLCDSEKEMTYTLQQEPYIPANISIINDENEGLITFEALAIGDDGEEYFVTWVFDRCHEDGEYKENDEYPWEDPATFTVRKYGY